MNRLDPHYLQSRLRGGGMRAKKHFGQHFLVDASVLADILRAARVAQEDTVVEIGPGPGVLTEALLQVSDRVIAFEVDPEMVRILKEDFPALDLVEGDALRLLPEVLPNIGRYKVVANIPYQITTPLLKVLLESGLPRPTSLTLLVQKEVGERLAAPAGNSSRGYLSVVCQLAAETKLVRTVPKQAFWPAPEVDSAVIHLRCRTDHPVPVEKTADFLKYVRVRFSQPRKQLKNVIAGIRGVGTEVVAAQFASLGIAPNARAQELTEAQWVTLFNDSV